MADCLAGSVKNGAPLLASTMPSLVLSAQGEASVSCGGVSFLPGRLPVRRRELAPDG